MSKEGLNFNATGITLLVMFGYGFLALLSDKISFDFRIAGGAILFIFIIEIIACWIESKYL